MNAVKNYCMNKMVYKQTIFHLYLIYGFKISSISLIAGGNPKYISAPPLPPDFHNFGSFRIVYNVFVRHLAQGLSYLISLVGPCCQYSPQLLHLYVVILFLLYGVCFY